MRRLPFGRIPSLSFLPFIVPMGIGSLLTARGVFTAGRMLAFVNLLNNLTFPLGRLPNHWASYKAALGSLERVYEIVDMEPERETGKHLITRSAQVVEFSQVDFAYNSEPVLEDLSFSVARGERVAIVGPSGSGKSTIFKLITGLRAPRRRDLPLRSANWGLEPPGPAQPSGGCVPGYLSLPATVREHRPGPG